MKSMENELGKCANGMPEAREQSALENSDWLSSTSAEFTSELLAGVRIHDACEGTMVSAGGDEQGELIALLRGVAGVSTALGAADSPVMLFLRPVSWFGFGPILAPEPRRFSVIAQTDVRLATVTTSRLS